MPTPQYLQDQLTKLKKQEGDLLKQQSATRTAAAKAREAANKKLEQARRTKSVSTVERLVREANRYEQEAAKQDGKAGDMGKKIGAIASKITAASKSLSQAETNLAKARDRDDQRRRRTELAHARQVAAASRPQFMYPGAAVAAPKPEPLRVAYLTASPEGEERLRVDREVREVRDAVKRALHRDLVVIESWPAATFDDVFNALNDQRPHVIHFSGHGSDDGLCFDGTDTDNPDGIDVNFGIIARVLQATDSPPTVLVLNACDSFEGAELLLDAVPVVVAMMDEISDVAAKAFATKFYAAIASGQSLASALRQGQTAIELLSGEGATPEVLARPRVDPQNIVLVTAPST